MRIALIISLFFSLPAFGQVEQFYGSLSTAAGYDADAQTYITAVEATGATMSTADKNAWNTFVLGMKSNSLWTKCTAIHPHYGNSATSNAINAKNPGTYNVTFTGTWSYSNGSDPDGASTTYGSTGLRANDLGQNDNHIAVYTMEDVGAGGQYVMGNNSAVALSIFPGNGSVWGGFNNDATGNFTPATTTRNGFYQNTRTASGTYLFVKNGSATTITQSSSLPSANTIYIGNIGAGAANGSPNKIGYDSVGSGFTSGEAATYSTLVQTLMTAWGR